MNPLIEFCINNLAEGSQKAKDELEKDPDLDVMDYGCLRNCGLCSQSNYALVEGERVIADSPEELVDKIYQHLDETL
ncbi:YuzB family protein [Halobacillus kuroshimensis]|uniref:YuzB family protein n=1 Tax=Halobacillus kuroshimensis TaxID=302481 RepID=A0ABS3DW20_9BACI|nr:MULTISPECIES: YuzB family protein [Halobacillus]MBN8235518.1 YuzB family protein [Halobacillus kuroshimensis]